MVRNTIIDKVHPVWRYYEYTDHTRRGSCREAQDVLPTVQVGNIICEHTCNKRKVILMLKPVLAAAYGP